MSCDRAESLLHGYLDGELDAAGVFEYEGHLRDCPVCVCELEAQQSLRARLRDAVGEAPPLLWRRIREHLASADLEEVDRMPAGRNGVRAREGGDRRR